MWIKSLQLRRKSGSAVSMVERHHSAISVRWLAACLNYLSFLPFLGCFACLPCTNSLATPLAKEKGYWQEPITGMRIKVPEGAVIQFEHRGIDAAIVSQDFVFKLKFVRLDDWVSPKDILEAELKKFYSKHKQKPKDGLIRAMEADAQEKFKTTSSEIKKTLGLEKVLLSELDNVAVAYPGARIIAKSWQEGEDDPLKPTLLSKIGGAPVRTYFCTIPNEKFGYRQGQQVGSKMASKMGPAKVKRIDPNQMKLQSQQNLKPGNNAAPQRSKGLYAQSILAANSGYLISIATEIAAEKVEHVKPQFLEMLKTISFTPWQLIAEKRVEEQNMALQWYERVNHKLRQQVLLPKQWYRIIQKERNSQNKVLEKDVGWMLINERWISPELAAKLKRTPGSPIKEPGIVITMVVNQIVQHGDSGEPLYQLNISEFFLDETTEVETWNIRSRRPLSFSAPKIASNTMREGMDYAEEIGFRFDDTLTVSRRTSQGLDTKEWELPARHLQKEKLGSRMRGQALRQQEDPENVDPRLKRLNDRPDMAGVYMPMVDVFLKPRLIGRLKHQMTLPVTMSFYTYVPTNGKLSYRRDVVREAQDKTVQLYSRPTLSSLPQLTVIDQNGDMVSHQLMNGREIRPASQAVISRIWMKDPNITRYLKTSK